MNMSDHLKCAIEQLEFARALQMDMVAKNAAIEEAIRQIRMASSVESYWLVERGSPCEWWVRGQGDGRGVMLIEAIPKHGHEMQELFCPKNAADFGQIEP